MTEKRRPDRSRLCDCGCGLFTARTHIPYKNGHEPLMTRILEKVAVDSNGCWIWTGLAETDGYGRVMFQYERVRVHRAVWAHYNGPIPEGLVVCHSCDVPLCCNPDHLFVGTIADNNADRDRKGRSKGGARRFTDDQIRDIRSAVDGGERPSDVARRFGTNYDYVWRVVSRRSRRSVA